MSTRAVYTFIDSDDAYHVYKHHDGYPSGAAEWIAQSVRYAWPLPRFEASDFGAAFIAGNKDSGGGVYLTDHYKNHGDLEYRYEITARDGDLYVRAFHVNYEGKDYSEQTFESLFEGTLRDFIKHTRADVG